MDITFNKFGVLYLRWKAKDGSIIEAVKEQVDFFGKEIFEMDYEDECKELDITPDGVTFNSEWEPTQKQLEESIQRTYSWMRDMEIM